MNPTTPQSPVASVLTQKEKQLFTPIFSSPELLVEILKWISDLKDRKSCALTCRVWEKITFAINFAQVNLKIEGFKLPIRICLFRGLAPTFSSPLISTDESWELLPRVFCINNNLIAVKSDPNFSSCIATHFCSLGPKPEIFIQEHVLLGEHNGNYLFQSPINSDKLVVSQNPIKLDRGKEIDLSCLTPVEDNGVFGDSIDSSSSDSWDENERETHVFRVCYPLSEEKMVLATKENGYIRAQTLDLKNGQITNTCLLKCKPTMAPITLNKHIIMETIMVNLETLKVSEHGFNFRGKQTASYESLLYVMGDNQLESYFINSNGKLENKWELQEFISEGDKRALVTQHLAAINDNYAALLCVTNDGDSPFWCIRLLDNQKNFIEEIRFSKKEISKNGSPSMHLIDDIFIYQDLKEMDLIFWHIPTKQRIQQIKWNGSRIFNIHSTKDKLIILTAQINGESKYQIHQFDLASFVRS